MTTEIWFEDAAKWGSELVDAVVPRQFAFTERTLSTKFSYSKWLDDYFPGDWKALLIRQDTAILAGAGSGVVDIPVWTSDKPLYDLENLAHKHDFVVARVSGTRNQTAAFARDIAKIQKTAESTIHVSGLWGSFPLMFGLGLKSVSCELNRDLIQTPYGKEEKTVSRNAAKWAMVLGFLPVDLEIPANRIIYNARSHAYASLYWTKAIGLPTMEQCTRDWTGAENAPRVAKISPATFYAKSTDRITCNTCSLANTCPSQRADSVCSIRSSPVSSLAQLFQTRDAETVITGLSELLSKGVIRLERGLENEAILEELDPEVSRIFDSLFDKGVKLAKLMDPNLNRPSTAVVVNTGGQQQINGFNPKAMVANVVRELESRGIPRDQITPDMMAKMLGSGTDAHDPTTVEVVDPRSPGKW